MNTKMNATGRLMATGWVRAVLLAASGFWLFAGEAHAQMEFAAEGRVGVTVPQGDLSDAGAETGIGLGAELQLNFRQNLTAYVGLHRHAFGCDNGCAPIGDNPTSTGVGAGLKYVFHNPGDVLVWGRGGVVANQLSTDDDTADREIGFELGVGADMPIAPRIYLVPNLGFISHAAGTGFSASFFSLGVGLHYHIN